MAAVAMASTLFAADGKNDKKEAHQKPCDKEEWSTTLSNGTWATCQGSGTGKRRPMTASVRFTKR